MKYTNASLYFSRGWYGSQVEIGKRQNRRQVKADIHGIFNVKGVKEALKMKLIDDLSNIDFSQLLFHYWKRREKIPRQALKMSLISPLAIGMGEGHALDIPGITLHRNYGFPYIPGSAVRGMVRTTLSQIKPLIPNSNHRVFSLMEHFLFGNIFDLRKKDLENKTFKGIVHFLSAVPVKGSHRLIEGDIINNHFVNYYTKNQPPVDTDNPRPVNFLRVPAATQFEFAWTVDEGYLNRWRYLQTEYNFSKSLEDAILAFAGDIIDAVGLDDDISNVSIDNLIQLLLQITGEYFGFGAKTRVGYGRFK